MAHRVVVMYAGRKVEEAPVEGIFERPLILHAGPAGLHATPGRFARAGKAASPRRDPAHGAVPARGDGGLPLRACAARTRPPVPRAEVPPMHEYLPGHGAACWEVAALPRARDARSRRPHERNGERPGPGHLARTAPATHFSRCRACAVLPDAPGPLRRRRAQGARGRRRELWHPPRRDARPRGRIGRGQPTTGKLILRLQDPSAGTSSGAGARSRT